ncbi:MAG: PEP/pyruvate-binding domain-containing protein [Chitinophagales bacterium]|nr:T9SS type A sorting domain-containing protein [Bacteroidota bacterium]MCB9042655.1 T9SS type A sorting domain-containing protein [Chitinophagales bacterium]
MKRILLTTVCVLPFILPNIYVANAQEVSASNYAVDTDGSVRLAVNSTTDNYYILKVRHDVSADFTLATSMTLGNAGTTIIMESTAAYPIEYYQVLEYAIDSPADTDEDGIDDVVEFQDMPRQNPLNAAAPIPINDGLVAVDNFTTFKELSVTEDFVQWAEFLNGKVYVKYIITDFLTSQPKTYFINSNTYALHANFANAMGIDYLGEQVKKGEIIYHPTVASSNGTLGTFSFNYSNGNGDDFAVVQKTYELLAANMPFLKNNLSHLITIANIDEYQRDSILYKNSRVPVLFEEEANADINYLGLNIAEGFGLFRQMDLAETPGPKDIVFYEALPNYLPRVGGIITSVMQTPLSHVNLRAIQDNIPNAFIRNPLSIDSIANLLGHYIYFKVEQDHFFIREASVQEVNDWFEDMRPDEEQIPPLNLNYTSILPLASISFDMYDGYGAKCANVAEMHTFGFPEGVIPDGFGVPFYFYQEFMQYNHLFEEIKTIMNQAEFQADITVREEKLKEFSEKINDSPMPNWMMNELEAMQQSFPATASIRCRSSSNVEDLPGFNGAGLYTSKTQYPDEGHIAKSIKQVYASFWNLRAFEEREFYNVNHFAGAMGVLCHLNYTDEKANGVGVSIDPIYNTNNTFYLNSQVGEDLITNPTPNAISEEILLDKVRVSENDFILIRHSNLVGNDSILMQPQYLSEIRAYLTVIHDRFALLYKAEENDNFAMEIEYKITSDNRLVIKQARTWVAYVPDNRLELLQNSLQLNIFPNPAQDYVNITCENCNIESLYLINSLGAIQKINFNPTIDFNAEINTFDFPSGIYFVYGIAKKQNYIGKFIKK